MTRLSSDGTWTNWTGDQSCRPAAFVRPRDEEELAHALLRARDRGWTVRVAGAGHSFTDGVLTDGMLLSLDRMKRLLQIDREAGTVRVQAGITLADLSEELDLHGLALENLGDINVQSLAGATATGTHGTGARYRNLSANIRSMRLMPADGTTVEVDEAGDADAWRAARISVGALGVVTEVTIKTVPAFTLRGADVSEPLDAVLASLEERVNSNDHFEFYAFPHSRRVMTRTNNRVDEAPRPRSRTTRWAQDIFLVNTVFGGVLRAGRRFPRAIPRLNRVVARLSTSRPRVDRSFDIFASPRLVRFTESEYALPREHVVEALREVLRMIERERHDVPIPLEVRFAAPDDALLSPAQGRETAYIAAHMFEKMEWEPYLRAVREVLRDFDARPHWGKRHFETASSLAPMYPEWDRFQAVRTRLDPEGTFANPHVRRVLIGS